MYYYLSKGRKLWESENGILAKCGARLYCLSQNAADLWRRGYCTVCKTTDKSDIDMLIALENRLICYTDCDDYATAQYRLLTCCIIVINSNRDDNIDIPLSPMDKAVIDWCADGEIYDIAELVSLLDRNILVDAIADDDSLLHKTFLIYGNKDIFEYDIDAEMEFAKKRDIVVESVFRLMAAGVLVAI